MSREKAETSGEVSKKLSLKQKCGRKLPIMQKADIEKITDSRLLKRVANLEKAIQLKIAKSLGGDFFHHRTS